MRSDAKTVTQRCDAAALHTPSPAPSLQKYTKEGDVESQTGKGKGMREWRQHLTLRTAAQACASGGDSEPCATPASQSSRSIPLSGCGDLKLEQGVLRVRASSEGMRKKAKKPHGIHSERAALVCRQGRCRAQPKNRDRER